MKAQERESLITYIGHATVMMEIDDRIIITDPVLRDRFMLLRRHGLPLEGTDREPDQVQIILLSHLHADHADPASLRRLPNQAILVAPRGAGLYLRDRVPQPILEMSAGDEITLGSLRVIATPAAHQGGRPLNGFNAPPLGYIVRGSITCYFAGDTDLFDEMSELGQRYRLDVALLPVAGCSPRTPAGHLNAHSAARAASMLRPRLAIPIHWGVLRPIGPIWQRLSYLQDPPYTFAGYVRQIAPTTEVRILQPGETTPVHSHHAATYAGPEQSP